MCISQGWTRSLPHLGMWKFCVHYLGSRLLQELLREWLQELLREGLQELLREWLQELRECLQELLQGLLQEQPLGPLKGSR